MSKFGWSYPPGAANDPFAPYNQDYDDEHCVYCGADLPDDVTGFSDVDELAVNDGFCNDEHRKLFDKNGVSEDWGKPSMTQDEKARYSDLNKRLGEWRNCRKDVPGTLADLIESLPEEDFKWGMGEAGDWHVYCCNDKDCEQQWHRIAYAEEFYRVDGNLTIMCYSVDEDGNWDLDAGYEESESDTFDGEVAYTFGSGPMNDYFHGWADYWLCAAITGDEPCGQMMREPETGQYTTTCLNAAESMIKALEPRETKTETD